MLRPLDLIERIETALPFSCESNFRAAIRGNPNDLNDCIGQVVQTSKLVCYPSECAVEHNFVHAHLPSEFGRNEPFLGEYTTG